MPQVIDRLLVQQLVQSGATLIEVLPRAEYEDAHIEGAIHIALTKLNKKNVQQLAKESPVIVYCNDYQ